MDSISFSTDDPDVTVVKSFFPEEGSIQLHYVAQSLCLVLGHLWAKGMLSSDSDHSQNDEEQANLNDTLT